MSFIQVVRQKLDSFSYSMSAKKFRKSAEWKKHHHNIPLPKTNWNELHQQVLEICDQFSVDTKTFIVDKADYRRFKEKFAPPKLALYAINCRDKKMMEHYIAYELLQLKEGERYLDVASENSPFPEMLRKRMGVEAFSLDLTYKPGIHGYQIGASAEQIPVKEGWIEKASLQCAFEHFQGDIDRNFIRELSRTLKPDGKCVILPLYMCEKLLNIYDPICYNSWNNNMADNDATIIAEVGLGGHYERFYDPISLRRIFIPDIGLKYTLHKIKGKKAALDKTDRYTLETVSRIRYALEIEKLS